MAFLPDLGAAALYAAVVFLLVLGFLVVFVESISNRQVAAMIVGVVVVAVGLASLGEPGLALLVFAVGAAFLANHTFEWLTSR